MIEKKISIPNTLKIYDGALLDVGKILREANFINVTLFYGEGIQELFGENLEKSLIDNFINLKQKYICDNNNIDVIADVAKSLIPTDVILGIGGGKSLDVTKYAGFLSDIPVINFPTAPSTDSICSPLASLYIEGRKTTINTRIPFGVIADTNILASSPTKFIFSGIGDLVAKYSSLYDWELEANYKKIPIDDFSRLLIKNSLESFLPYIQKNINDKKFLSVLIESLLMSGLSMEINGNSAPASGSEHLISHALDHILEFPHLHGIQVGIATYITTNIQNNHNKDLVNYILTETGFWDFVLQSEFDLASWLDAIDKSYLIKPERHTTVHIPEKREQMKEFIFKDQMLKNIFKLP